jgi:AbrB family looped-hinge helix DNA binding protein
MMQSYTVRLRERGQLTIPQDVRENLTIHDGDLLTLIQVDELLLLTPKKPLIPQLSAQFSALMDEQGVTLADLLEGLEKERELIWRERHPDGA